MSYGWFNRIALIAILMLAMVACDPTTEVSPAATSTLAPSPKLAATQLAELMTRGEPDDPIVCAADDAAEFEAVPGARPGAKWAVIFEYEFVSDRSIGQHTYTLWFEPCRYAGELPDHVTSSIMITSSESQRAAPVYFGPLGVTSTKSPYSSTLEAIHPAQAATARISDIQLTQDEAQTVARECVVWMSWDDDSVRHELFTA